MCLYGCLLVDREVYFKYWHQVAYKADFKYWQQRAVQVRHNADRHSLFDKNSSIKTLWLLKVTATWSRWIRIWMGTHSLSEIRIKQFKFWTLLLTKTTLDFAHYSWFLYQKVFLNKTAARWFFLIGLSIDKYLIEPFTEFVSWEKNHEMFILDQSVRSRHLIANSIKWCTCLIWAWAPPQNQVRPMPNSNRDIYRKCQKGTVGFRQYLTSKENIKW